MISLKLGTHKCVLSTRPAKWLCLYCANDAWCHLHSCHAAWWAGTDWLRHEIHLSFISLEPLIVLSLWAVKVCLDMGLCLSMWCEAKWFCVHLWLFDDCLISVCVCVSESFLCGVCLTLVVLHLVAWNELSTGLCFYCVVTRQFALCRKLLTLQCHCYFLLKLWLRGHCVTLSGWPEIAHFINSTNGKFLLVFSLCRTLNMSPLSISLKRPLWIPHITLHYSMMNWLIDNLFAVNQECVTLRNVELCLFREIHTLVMSWLVLTTRHDGSRELV